MWCAELVLGGGLAKWEAVGGAFCRVNGFYGRVEKVREEVDEFLEMVVKEHLNKGSESSDGNINNENFVDILLKASSSIDRDGHDRWWNGHNIFDSGVGVELVLVNLVHKFDWKLPMGAICEDLDLMEEAGVAVHRKHPLIVLFDLHSKNVICRAAFGRRFVGGRFAVVLRELFRLMATVEIGEFVPFLSWISLVNGFDSEVEKVREEVDEFLEMVVEEHISRGLEGSDAVDENKEFFLDILLKASIDRDGIKAILLAEILHLGRSQKCSIQRGIALAIASVEVMLANLVHKFGWKLPMGAKCEDLDVMEQPGVNIHRKNPLLVVPISIGT
ncbi:hypothetical protein SASPL_136570 [Salvia splendens]|uniref:Uncharacterized protein n=1 Tax=Salvia splendens TaxID=180675 RepID=A0A8X8ZHN6_SALSN|nr:hypothetical protein SASPL_136570 [Salvia splendens]